jgi:hypothetical protein
MRWVAGSAELFLGEGHSAFGWVAETAELSGVGGGDCTVYLRVIPSWAVAPA